MKTKVTTLQQELDTQIPMARIKRAIITSFNSVYDTKVKQGKLSREEVGIVKRLYESKYATEERNARDTKPCVIPFAKEPKVRT